ncbi:MAG: Tol-Pal system protein TolB [Betaproteobacteria bacterium]|nr:Tol-Pal system protein TolB [Betaproteobacteria bacterium]MBK6599992.1 Tol-Pal system protein TolB [Betaproteobacteria bacterium]MBK7080472.1 Tol-Pal system protein TolB [Betaproteobacteria bacterium]MBK9705276.1 Tol-Pal system protein TolB [Betaproteobacteria bacterium]MBL0292626.1 Tol-Pal system protein TolB [Betaproteobacteria bacterium]
MQFVSGNRLRRLLKALFPLLLLGFVVAVPARAQLTIEIVGGSGSAIPIAVVPFENESNWPLGITGVVAADLTRSGLFRQIEANAVVPRPVRAEDVRGADWRARGADAVVVGSMRSLADGRVEVRFALVDAVKQMQLAAVTYTVTPAQFRATAHRIADVIYEKLTGDAGVFSTRIAYITKQGARYELHVADADGSNPQAVVASNEPLLSPAWSPDGTRIAYVSLENRKPVIYVQSLDTGRRQVLANFRGSNSAPAWSPDGRKLIVTLTKDGGSQLFLINADGTGVQRLLSSTGIDTEASFAPDGQSVLFTSDRGGSPQIYRLRLATNAVERLTFEGSYNVSPRALPDGKGFVFVRREGGRFTICIQDFATRQVQVLTQGPLDESPSVAPNSRLVIYAAQQGGRGILAGVSSDGRVKQRLVSPATNVREPAWGPLPR